MPKKKDQEVSEEVVEETQEAKKTPKKRTPKKTTQKKTTKKTEPEEVIEEQEEKEEKVQPAPKPKRRKVADIDRNEMIPVYSAVEGSLVYVSKRTGLEITWGEMGDEQYLEYGELMNMKSSQPKFFTEPFILIEDEDVVEKLGLKDTYDRMIKPEEMDKFFDMDINEMKLVLQNAPNGTKKTIANSAGKRVSSGSLYDIRKIKMLQKELNIDLEILM